MEGKAQMNTEIIEISGKSFLKIDLLNVQQGSGTFFVGKIPAKNLIECFTVEPAEYASQENKAIASSFEDDRDYYEYLQNDLQNRMDSKAFQRKEEKDRINKIKKFLEGTKPAFFPNAIIATCELINEKMGIDEKSEFDESLVSNLPDESNLSFYQVINSEHKLFIPLKANTLLIIDGQHRIKGLEASDLEKIGPYELLITFIIGFDKSVVANLFYTVNYHQKTVNKSLLYHLMGEFSRNIDEVTFLHQVVRLLNELEKSPLCTRIKMLGVSPVDLPEDRKKLATVSQAFLVDELLPTINARSTSSVYQPVFFYFYSKSNHQIEIVRILIAYFQAIEEIFGTLWTDVEGSVVSKSISIGAFLKVFRIIFVKLLVSKFNLNIDDMVARVSKDDFEIALKGVQNIDFSKDGEFGGVGSGGSSGKIKKKIVENAAIFKGLTYDNVIEDFKNKENGELNKFRKWLDSV